MTRGVTTLQPANIQHRPLALLVDDLGPFQLKIELAVKRVDQVPIQRKLSDIVIGGGVDDSGTRIVGQTVFRIPPAIGA